MDVKDFTSEQVVAGWLLILSGVLFVPGGLLYTGRAILRWPAGQTQGYLYWERGLILAAILVAALGLVLLERLLETGGDGILAPIGMVIFLIGTGLVFVAETTTISRQEQAYALVVAFIMLIFFGEAAFGASILRTGFFPHWVGWVTVIWNLAWLVILPITRPQDMYYPWLFYAAPEMIGIMLLFRG